MIEQIDVFPVRIVSHDPGPLTMPPQVPTQSWRLGGATCSVEPLLRVNTRARWQLERGQGTQSQEHHAQAADRGELGRYRPRRRG
jgi:hypothetical protein